MFLVAFSYQFQKVLMYHRIGAHLGVECCRKCLAFSHQHRVGALSCQYLDTRAHLNDLGGTNEYHFQWRITEASLPDGAFKLAPVGIAADADIERAKASLRRILYFTGEQDAPGTGAEDGLVSYKLLQLGQTLLAEKLQKCARFSTGDDKAIEPVELVRISDERDFRAELFEADAVGVEISLQRQDSDFHAGLILMDRGRQRAAVPA
jgi:hypothetical protein